MTTAIASTLVYTIIVLTFLFHSLKQNLASTFIPGILITAIFILAVGVQFYRFTRSAKDLRAFPRLTFHLGEMAAVLLGALATAFITRHFSLSPVIASSITGIVGVLLFPTFPFSIFCGSFIGMTSAALMTYSQIVLAALLSGLVFIYGRHGYHGMGGKLGVTAFIGVWAVVFFGSTVTGDAGLSDAIRYPAGTEITVIILLSAAASFLTYMLNGRWNIHIVASAGIVGMVSTVALTLWGVTEVGLFASAVYCASFAGMCNRNRLQGPGMFFLVGILSGLLFIVTLPVFYQFGGKLGMIAFIAALAAKSVGEWLQPSAHEFFCEE